MAEKVISFVVGNCLTLNIRKSPSIKSEVLFKINKDERVVIDGYENDWFLIHLENDPNKVGYANVAYIKEED